MKKLLIALILIGNLSNVNGQNSQISQNKMNTFIKKLMSRMTLDEKIGQLNLLTGGEATTGSVISTGVEEKIKKGSVGGLFSFTTPQKIRKVQEIAVKQSRLGIPLIFGQDVIHGYKTTFPIPLALACSWDMDMIEKTARIAAIEASADGLNWTFSPMVDVSRDPRWGRISEGSGEDPYLGSQIAKAMIKGYQQNNLSKNNTIMACVKHFALYGAAESGRDYNTTDMSLHRMYNEYFPPYKAAIDAGVGSVMTSFNDINGIPATANKWLMTNVLRKQWGFKGMIVTDYTAINELIDHGLGDLQKVSQLALQAGADMDMVGEGYLNTLKSSLLQKKINIKDINRACRLILEAKYKLGLFDDPYRYCNEERAKTEILKPEHLAYARKSAANTMVLLKNEQQILPLTKKGSIALIGPLANTGSNMPGTWSVNSELNNTQSVLEGFKQVLGNQVTINYAMGSNLISDEAYQNRATMFGRTIPRDNRSEQEMIYEAINIAKNSDIIIATLGEASEMSGESSSRTNIQIPEVQQRLLKALLSTEKPLVLVVFNGRPLDLSWENKHVPAILDAWFGGTETAKALVDVLFGDVNPSGKITASFPKNVGQIPIYYSHKNTGRPLPNDSWFQKFKSNYLDVDNEPLYPFGYGLSYTQFNYSNLKLSKSKMKKGETITVSISISNTGKYAGDETVQMYLRDMIGSVTRPVKELKGFQKIHLEAGENKIVNFNIDENMLKFFNENLQWMSEPGGFKVFIGTNSRDVKEADFELL